MLAGTLNQSGWSKYAREKVRRTEKKRCDSIIFLQVPRFEKSHCKNMVVSLAKFTKVTLIVWRVASLGRSKYVTRVIKKCVEIQCMVFRHQGVLFIGYNSQRFPITLNVRVPC